MRGRTATLALTWNGVAVTTQLSSHLISATYTDPACGESDTLEISLLNRGMEWANAWRPAKGDWLEGELQLENWEGEGAALTLSIGSMTLDGYSISGPPSTAQIQALSTPADGGFSETKRDKIWEQVTVEEVAKEIAGRAGLPLVWDVEAQPLVIPTVEQSRQTDAEFLQSLCTDYGYAMKVYSNQLVLFDREEYKKKTAAHTIAREELLSYQWQTTLAGTYTGGTFTYTDPYTEENVTAQVGGGARLLVLEGKANSQAEAERKLQAAIDQANHGATTLQLSIPGNGRILAGQCINVNGLGNLSGKYFVDQVTHTIGDGYTMDLELSQVEEGGEAAVLDAINRLAMMGVLVSPEYWEQHWNDLPYLGGLLLNLSASIRTNNQGTAVTDMDQALDTLASRGVINTPEYWQNNHAAVPYLDTLLVSAANALE